VQEAFGDVEALRGALRNVESSALDGLTRSLFAKADAATHFIASGSAHRATALPTLPSVRAEIDAAVGASAAARLHSAGAASSGGSGVRFISSLLPFPNANFVFFTSKAAAAQLASDWTSHEVLVERASGSAPGCHGKKRYLRSAFYDDLLYTIKRHSESANKVAPLRIVLLGSDRMVHLFVKGYSAVYV
jgi:hypothetical protein